MRAPLKASLGRIIVALGGGVGASFCVALVEARSGASLFSGRISVTTLLQDEIGLLAPLAFFVAFAVALFDIFLVPDAPRSLRQHAAALRSEPVLTRSRTAAIAPLGVAVFSTWAIVCARLAEIILANGGAAEAGIELALASLASFATLSVCALAVLPPLRRALAAGADRLPRLLDPATTGACAMIVFAGIFAYGIHTGDASGQGGGVVGIFGVLKRHELDLRPVVDLVAIATGAYVAPIAFARPRAGVLEVVAASIVALAPQLWTLHTAHAMNGDPTAAQAIDRGAPLGKIALAVLRKITDRDRDGASPFFGGGDCNDRNAHVSPNAIDVPGNGIDEDCSGGDLPLPKPVEKPKPATADERLENDLNLILITIDHVAAGSRIHGLRPADVTESRRARERFGRVRSRVLDGVVHGKKLGAAAHRKISERDGAQWLALHDVRKVEHVHRGKTEKCRLSYVRRGVALVLQRVERAIARHHRVRSLRKTRKRAGRHRREHHEPRAHRRRSSHAQKSREHERTIFHVDPLFRSARSIFGARGRSDFHRPGVSESRAAYDAEVWFTDKHVGRLLDYVRSQEFGKHTAIVVTSDHGEAFNDHGMSWHGGELWESLVHVPLVFYVPGVKPHRVPVKRGHIDVVPTLLEILKQPAPPAGELSGVSMLADILNDGDHADDLASYPERDVYLDMPVGPYTQMRRGVLHGTTPGLKLIHFGGNTYNLFDLATDPAEATDIAGDKTRFDPVFAAFQTIRGSLKEVDATPDPTATP